MYRHGLGGLPQSDALAVEWYRKAADQGDAAAQNNLALMYRDGRGGLPQSDALAVEWYRKAADQGDADAQFNLGLMYANGQGVPQNFPEALRWLRKAHAQGFEQAASAIEAVLRMQREQQQGAAAAASTSAASSSPSSSSPIPIGTRVELHGLKMKKLNRQRGVVAGFDAGSGRCVVKLEDGQSYKFKAENLEVAGR